MTQLPTTRTVRRARKAQRRGAMQRRVTGGATLLLIGLAGILVIGLAGGPGAHGSTFTVIACVIAGIMMAGGLALLGWGLVSSDPEERPARTDAPIEAPVAAAPRRRR